MVEHSKAQESCRNARRTKISPSYYDITVSSHVQIVMAEENVNFVPKVMTLGERDMKAGRALLLSVTMF